jgi:YD repeat-containing protein
MAAMTTWTNFASDAGAAVTTWQYHPQTGLLAAKKYPLPVGEGQGEGPSDGYTPGGRLLTRTWARGIATTYGYDNAGALATVAYSDGTPTISHTYTRRRHRGHVSIVDN